MELRILMAVSMFTFLTALCPFSAHAMSCSDLLKGMDRHPISKGVENSTFADVRRDLMNLVGNDVIGEYLRNLTSRSGLRLQIANITGTVGNGRVHFSRVVDAKSDGLIDLRDLEDALREAGRKAELSGEPILNTSVLISRELNPAIYEEDRHYADQVYEVIFQQLMQEYHLSRQQLMGMSAGLKGKVWYFVAQTNSKPDGNVVIYDPSKK